MADTEYLIRRERLKSEVEQSRGSPSGAQAKLDQLYQELGSLSDEGPTKQDLLVVQKVEAELCLYKPKELLFPTYTRLKSKLYRFDPDRCEAWLADLKRLFPDNHTTSDEAMCRQRLRQLTFELFEEAEAFNRLSRERSRVLRNLIMTGVVMLALLSLSGWLVYRHPPESPDSFVHWLMATCIAGAIGAAVSSLASIRQEKQRDDYQSTLQWQMISRAVLGLIYAMLVYSATFSNVVPLKYPTEANAQGPFFLALGFIAGFSDKLFGQTVSQFITKSSAPAAKGKSKGSGSS